MLRELVPHRLKPWYMIGYFVAGMQLSFLLEPLKQKPGSYKEGLSPKTQISQKATTHPRLIERSRENRPRVIHLPALKDLGNIEPYHREETLKNQ